MPSGQHNAPPQPRPGDIPQHPRYFLPIMTSSNDIRAAFLDYFARNGHTVVDKARRWSGQRSHVVVHQLGDGAIQGRVPGRRTTPLHARDHRARSVRAGGKHNDLENVGYTARHHTFFEMLGNFSFGDYFKRDAIHYCWELLTEVYGLPQDRLLSPCSPKTRSLRNLGKGNRRAPRSGSSASATSDNFWQMADTGPCGPCSEVFYDHGPESGVAHRSPEEDGDRFIEIWNLVFMQFNRDAQGYRVAQQCVDTGMGLERLAAVLQHVHSNYEIDLFQALIKASVEGTGQDPDARLTNNSL